jgi:hypothetical protein
MPECVRVQACDVREISRDLVQVSCRLHLNDDDVDDDGGGNDDDDGDGDDEVGDGGSGGWDGGGDDDGDWHNDFRAQVLHIR